MLDLLTPPPQTIPHLEIDDDVERISTVIKNADINRHYNAEQKVFKASKVKSITKGRSMRAVPLPPIAFKAVPVNANPQGFDVRIKRLEIFIPSSNDQRLKVYKSDDNALSTFAKRASIFEIGLPNHDEKYFYGKSKVALDNSIIYPDYDEETDVAVQVFNDAARILTILNGKNAPSEFSYEIVLPAGVELVKDEESGALIILDSEDKFMGGFAPPWAIDSDGKEVPTHFDIQGNHLIQVIDHTDSNINYPVVADPWMGWDLIESAYWDYRSPGMTLFVSPTWLARAWGGYYFMGIHSWNEVYFKYRTLNNFLLLDNYWGMRDQHICHQQHAWFKPTWNLDVWRPDVSYFQTVIALCNPV